MPAVLVTGRTATQKLPFLPHRWPKPSSALTVSMEGWPGWVARMNTGIVQRKEMRDEGVTYVAGYPLLSRRCTRLPGCIRLRKWPILCPVGHR